MIKIIAAVTNDLGLGRRGDLLYHIPADLKHFKSLTMGHAIVMGRKTFESFPKGALPGRRNIVITSNPDYTAPGIETYNSLESAIKATNNDCFIIGGGNVYTKAMPMAGQLLLTCIDAASPDGTDTFFPAIDRQQWTLVEHSAPAVDEKSGVTYRFLTYEKKS